MYLQSLLATFLKNCFPAAFGLRLEFLRKMQKRVYLGMERDRAILTKVLTRRVSVEYTGIISQKCFTATFGGHLEFLFKYKNVFISETERDRAILTKFLTHRVSAESTGDFSQKSFSCHFWRPS